jgi:ribosomal protein S18 acetylase RimI-like enzyme
MSSTDPWRKFGRDFAACIARLRRPEYTILLARRDSAPCGFLFLHPNGVAGSPYIASIVTSAEVRGQGVGSALLDAAEHWIPGARHIFLCVSSFNTSARRLYERRGYTQVGEFPDYVVDGFSEILMLKRLVSA